LPGQVLHVSRNPEKDLLMSSEIAVKVNHLSKCYHIYNKPRDRLLQLFARGRKQYYRDFWALNDISFEIKKGETIGIIGRNGSGKSTLLQLICGTLYPTQGLIETHGRIAALLELGSGFNPEFTGRENVYMNASILGLSKEEIHKRFDDIIAFAGIGDFIEQPVKTYSSGMMLRLAFAVIAHVDADILIVDEALAVGDAFFTQKCMRFLRDFMKNGTVLFVSHDTASIKSLCNRAVWLEAGRIVQEGSPKEICELYLEAYYEAQQGKSKITRLTSPGKSDTPRSVKDQRMDFINHSNLRNDLQIFRFDSNAPSFGKGGAQIYDVQLLNENHHPLSWVVGGETVTLRIHVRTHVSLDAPIIGFFVKDHLGQTLFGDNTYLTYRDIFIKCSEGKSLQAHFVFCMPLLPTGAYSITASIANGTQDEHEQHATHCIGYL
jgi:lipopolysaccharide transport system ATP-binding protein